MGGSNSRNITNNSVTECEGGKCERVSTSCVDGDCTETRTPIEDDVTLEEEGDEIIEEEGDEIIEEEGDEIIDIDQENPFSMGTIIFIIFSIFLVVLLTVMGVYNNKSKIPNIPKNIKNPNLNKV